MGGARALAAVGAVAAGLRQRAGPASVAPLVPPAGPGRVLTTSRTRSAARPGHGAPLLEPQVAAEFLVSRPVIRYGGGPGLAAQLAGLPPALEQAAAYVQASGESLAVPGLVPAAARRTC